MDHPRSTRADYDPLPQILTDSEDDDENPKAPNDHVVLTDTSPAADNSADSNRRICRHLQSDGKRMKESLSRTRYCAFVLSIFFAILTVASFLWVIPCQDEMSICSSVEKEDFSFWTKVSPAFALSKAFEMIDVDGDGLLDVVFSMQPVSVFNSSVAKKKDSAGGAVIAMSGINGKNLWHHSYFSVPTHISCANALDVKPYGIGGCIIVGENGLMSAVNVANGNISWYLHDHDHLNLFHPSRVSVPIIVPDVTEDGIADLVVPCLFDSSPFLTVVSGAMGELVGRPVLFSKCSFISSLTYLSSADLSAQLLFHCKSHNSSSVTSILLSDLMNLVEGTTTSTANTSTEVFRFDSVSEEVCILKTYLNGDDDYDVVVAGGNGQVAALHGQTWQLMWTHNWTHHRILNCTNRYIGNRQIIIFTYVDEGQLSEDPDSSFFIVAVDAINGSVIWSHSDKAILFPVIMTGDINNRWLAYKSTSISAPFQDDQLVDKKRNEIDFYELEENLVFFNVIDGRKEVFQLPNTISVLCDDIEFHFEWCYPSVAFHKSVGVADLNDDGILDVIFIKTSVVPDSFTGNWSLQLNVIKRSLPSLHFD